MARVHQTRRGTEIVVRSSDGAVLTLFSRAADGQVRYLPECGFNITPIMPFVKLQPAEHNTRTAIFYISMIGCAYPTMGVISTVRLRDSADDIREAFLQAGLADPGFRQPLPVILGRAWGSFLDRLTPGQA